MEVESEMPPWVCSSCGNKNKFCLTVCVVKDCGSSNPLFLPPAPAWRVRLTEQLRGPGHIRDIGSVGDGMGGTLTSQSLATCFGGIPRDEKKDMCLLDIGCASGDVLLFALSDGWGAVTGIETRDFELAFLGRYEQYSVLWAAHDNSIGVCSDKTCFCSTSSYNVSLNRVVWSKALPVIRWGVEAQAPRVGLTPRALKWNKNITVFLFWKGWKPAHKHTVLLKIIKDERVKYVMVTDSCKTNSMSHDHRDTIGTLLSQGFFLKSYRAGVKAAGSGQGYAFLLMERKQP